MQDLLLKVNGVFKKIFQARNVFRKIILIKIFYTSLYSRTGKNLH